MSYNEKAKPHVYQCIQCSREVDWGEPLEGGVCLCSERCSDAHYGAAEVDASYFYPCDECSRDVDWGVRHTDGIYLCSKRCSDAHYELDKLHVYECQECRQEVDLGEPLESGIFWCSERCIAAGDARGELKAQKERKDQIERDAVAAGLFIGMAVSIPGGFSLVDGSVPLLLRVVLLLVAWAVAGTVFYFIKLSRL